MERCLSEIKLRYYENEVVDRERVRKSGLVVADERWLEESDEYRLGDMIGKVHYKKNRRE